MVHINAKIKNGIQHFINIAILRKGNIHNLLGIILTTEAYFVIYIKGFRIKNIKASMFRIINQNVSLHEKLLFETQSHVS